MARSSSTSRPSLARILYGVAFLVAVIGASFALGFRLGQHIPMPLTAYFDSEVRAPNEAAQPLAPPHASEEPTSPQSVRAAEEPERGATPTIEANEDQPASPAEARTLERVIPDENTNSTTPAEDTPERSAAPLPEGQRRLSREAPTADRRAVYAEQDG